MRLVSRRHALAATWGSLLAAPSRAAPRPLQFRDLQTPEPIAQIAAGGPTGLLGINSGGVLWALPLGRGSAQRLGEGLDSDTPLAVGYGRLAARRLDGALWVLETAGRTAASAARTLAPAAGLLILPLAVIGIEADDGPNRAMRLEPSATGSWSRVARSEVVVLPDARPIQADLDGAGDGGHVVLLGGPDAERYPHGVLGDRIEATRICWLERHSLRLLRELVLDAPQVFEDIAPRKLALPERDGLLTVQSGPLGARLTLIDADPATPGALRVAASGQPLGKVQRWMSPITDGRHCLAVHTPHIGGVLHVYQRQGSQLVSRRVLTGVSNHRIGSRRLDVSAWHGQRLLVPDQEGFRLLLLDAATDWQVVGEQTLSSRVATVISLRASGAMAMLLEDGTVMVSGMTEIGSSPR